MDELMTAARGILENLNFNEPSFWTITIFLVFVSFIMLFAAWLLFFGNFADFVDTVGRILTLRPRRK